jgi:hypothetical protein
MVPAARAPSADESTPPLSKRRFPPVGSRSRESVSQLARVLRVGLRLVADIWTGIPVNAGAGHRTAAKAGVTRARKNRDTVHERAAVDKGHAELKACIDQRIGVKADAANEPGEVAEQGAEREPAAMPAVDIQGDEASAGADRQRRPIRAEADKSEISGQLSEAVWGDVGQPGHAVEPFQVATALQSVPTLDECEPPQTHYVAIGRRVRKGCLGGNPTGSRSPHVLEPAGPGEAFLHAVEELGIGIRHREEVCHWAEGHRSSYGAPRRSFNGSPDRSYMPTPARSSSASPGRKGGPHGTLTR